MRVLLVEPDEATAEFMDRMLSSHGFNLHVTDNGEEALSLGRHYDNDIIMTELILRDMSGYTLIKRLRMEKVKTPLLVLSSRGDVEDKVKGFDAGADDYVTKPFHQAELMARVYALVRRSNGHIEPRISIGNVMLDVAKKRVTVLGQPIVFSAKEYQTLEVLFLNKGAVVKRTDLIDHLYGGEDGAPEYKTVDVFIYRVRKKLAEANEGVHYINNVRGTGYLLDEVAHAAF